MHSTLLRGTAEPISEQAAAWLVKRRAGELSAAEQRTLDEWLAENNAHRQEFERLAALWDEMEPLRDHPIVAVELRSRTSAASRALSGFIPRFAIAGVALAIAGWVAWDHWTAPQIIRTASGEIRSIALEDGSKIEIDAETHLTIDAGSHVTQIVIEQGSAFFTVTHRPERLFEVRVGQYGVRDIGTQFGISRENGKISISVLDGEVEVRDKQSPSTQTRRLIAGQGFALTGNAADEATAADADAYAWREGKLVFDNAPLSEVIRRVNRYRHDPITIADTRLESMKISGVFRLDDTRSLLWALSKTLPLRVIDAGGRISLIPS